MSAPFGADTHFGRPESNAARDVNRRSHMTESQGQSVQLVESNRTLRKWMELALEEGGFEVHRPEDDARVDIVVVDVESSREEYERRFLSERANGEPPVLLVGFRDSRVDLEGGEWLTRPCRVDDFVTACRSLLVPDGGEPESQREETSAGEGESGEENDSREGEGEASASDGTGDVENVGDLVTDEVVDEMVAGLDEEAEEEAGGDVQSGVDSDRRAGPGEAGADSGPVSEEEGEREGEVLEIDDGSSMVVDVLEIEGGGSGGAIAGEVTAESLDLAELEREAESLESGELLSDPKANPTLPDVPAYRDGGERDGGERNGGEFDGGEQEREGDPAEGGSGVRQPESDPGPASGSNTTGARRQRSKGSGVAEPNSSGGGPLGGSGEDRDSGAARIEEEKLEAPPPDLAGDSAEIEPVDVSTPTESRRFERELAEVAGLLAESWSRLGLTARWEDRAERLKRIFSAFAEQGVEGASEELDRIPPAHGFSGTLTVFPALELIRLVREKRFLGRLEVSHESGGYVLYLDGNRLVGIDDLEGRSEAMLLDCLRQSETVDHATYEQLVDAAEDSLGQPLEMRLRTEGLVTDEQLLDARRTRAKRVVEEVVNATTGSFAFIHGGDESGQPWPVNELGLSIDVLLLELLRAGSVDWSPNEQLGPEAFVAAGHRLGDEQQTALALVERRVLNACAEPRRLDELARELEMGPSQAEQVVRRLRAVGFLEPTGAPGSEDQRESGGVSTEIGEEHFVGGGNSTTGVDDGRTRKIDSSGGLESAVAEDPASQEQTPVDDDRRGERPDETRHGGDETPTTGESLFGESSGGEFKPEGDTENDKLPLDPDEFDDVPDDSSSE